MVQMADRLLTGAAERLVQLAQICTIGMLAAVAGNAIMRYFVGAPLMSFLDLATLLLLLSTFLAFPVMAAEDSYIRVAVFNFRSTVGRRLAAIVRTLLLLGFYLALSRAAFERAIEYYQLQVATIYARIPLWPSSIVILVTILLSLAVYLLRNLQRR